jgi:transposase
MLKDQLSMISPSDLAAIRKALNHSKTAGEFKKVLCVWLKVALSLPSKEIALGIGTTPEAVRKIQSRFAKEGLQAFLGKQRGGRKRENISLAREKQILEKFLRRAQRGAVVSVVEIQRAYELSAGKAVAQSTIYRLLARHGLRRYLPRARAIRSNGAERK